jgi:hypothetical protein
LVVTVPLRTFGARAGTCTKSPSNSSFCQWSRFRGPPAQGRDKQEDIDMTHSPQNRWHRAARAELVAAVAVGLFVAVGVANTTHAHGMGASPQEVQAAHVSAAREIDAFEAANLFEQRVADASAPLNAPRR